MCLSVNPLEPVREAPPQQNIKKTVTGPPRTPYKPKGGKYQNRYINGEPAWSGQDVRLFQDTPTGDRLRKLQEEVHQVQAGVLASPVAPLPIEMGVFCIPICHL